jgi:hypothetical protein
MSRSGYSDDLDWGSLNLYRANVARTIAGKKGQAFLKEMLAALDALPEKRLIHDELEAHGEVCAIGAVGKARGIKMDGIDPEDREAVAELFHITPMLAAEIVYMNDEWGVGKETPEDCWTRMRKWVADQIVAG